ncbi:MAG: hypothetical protein Q8930_11685 [Bacillota bacterium]|nr:hypothetical protein [Bacillota bacterium]
MDKKEDGKENDIQEYPMGSGITSRKKTDIESLTRAKDFSMKKSLEGTDEKFMT